MEITMIASIKQNGPWIYVYDEQGHQTCMIAAGENVNFTSTTISIQRGSFTYIYDENGREMGMV